MALPPNIAAAFAAQAEFCRLFGATLTGSMCAATALVFEGDAGASARAVRGWAGDPMADALMMRVTGAFNALVRSGDAPELAPLYPPADLPDIAALAAAVAAILADPARDALVMAWLAGPPQTNEIGRSGVLMPALMVVADACRLPLRLFELGCSAGLNLNLDRFGYDLGGRRVGDAASSVQLAPVWSGEPPPLANVVVVDRRGVDIQPLDVTDTTVRARLMAYVWPEQLERVARAQAAIALALAHPPAIDGGDAAEWVERMVVPEAGTVAVVFHSIAWQYFSAETKARTAAHLEKIGGMARVDAPIAWLRYEMDDPAAPEMPSLRLRLWRGGVATDQLLARAHPHGSFVQWG